MEKKSTVPQRGMVLLLCTLFLVLCGAVALLAGRTYYAVSAQAQENSNRRTALFYLTNQVKETRDGGGEVALTAFGDAAALALKSGDYTTTLYCHDGWLMELYAETGLDFSPQDGTPILPLAEMKLETADGLLLCTLTLPEGTVLQGEVSLT